MGSLDAGRERWAGLLQLQAGFRTKTGGTYGGCYSDKDFPIDIPRRRTNKRTNEFFEADDRERE